MSKLKTKYPLYANTKNYRAPIMDALHSPVIEAVMVNYDELEIEFYDEDIERLVVCANAMQGIDDPNYFMKNIKKELKVIEANLALILEQDGEGEIFLEEGVENILNENGRRILFLLSLFPAPQSEDEK